MSEEIALADNVTSCCHPSVSCSQHFGATGGGAGLYVMGPPGRIHRLLLPLWGLGYATEAARAIVDAGFRQPQLHRIWSTVDDENVASGRVLEKLGMQQEGLLRQDVNLRGQWRDSRILAILRHEWNLTPD
jgi:hypothetical protein